MYDDSINISKVTHNLVSPEKNVSSYTTTNWDDGIDIHLYLTSFFEMCKMLQLKNNKITFVFKSVRTLVDDFNTIFSI